MPLPRRLFWAAAIFLVSIVDTISFAAETNNAVQAPIAIMSAQGLTAIANLLSAILWPLIALTVVLIFRVHLIKLLSRLKIINASAFRLELADDLIQKSGKEAEAAGDKAPAPTEKEVVRSGEVERLSRGLNDAELRQQLSDLANEYERVRASLPPGNDRTLKMTAVAAKMRAAGLIAYRFRYKLVVSPSPGERLLAICALQIQPDFDLINWLAKRVEVEKPFVVYQALWALIRSAENPLAKSFKLQLTAALTELNKVDFGTDTGRSNALRRYRGLVEKLDAGTSTQLLRASLRAVHRSLNTYCCIGHRATPLFVRIS